MMARGVTRTAAARADIQALRALAIASVFIYHLWPTHFSGGFIGVDIFFVISGFLITGQLWREVEVSGRVEFAKFWSAYPRKTAKGEAYQAWLKANPPLDAVLKSLDWQRGCEDWTKGGGQFIPHPSTYLHQRRWEDERTTTTPVLTVIKHNCEYEGCDRPSNLMTERGRRCVNHISK